MIRLAVILGFVLFFLVFACNLEDGEGEATAPVVTPPAPVDTCKPPACYPDPKPPGPPR